MEVQLSAGEQWYVIRTVSGQERKVKKHIELERDRLNWQDKIPQILIPIEKVFEVRNGKKISRERIYLPGYIIMCAHIQGEVLQMIKDIPGVIGFLGSEKRGKRSDQNPPIPLRKSEIDALLGHVEEFSRREEIPENPYTVGEQVKVMDGPFKDFDGIVEKVLEDKRKLRVMVKFFGRDQPIELNFVQVEKIN